MKLTNVHPEVVTHHALTGSFGQVRYFLTTLDLRDAAENLQLLPQENLDFRERIQRVVNEERVVNGILPYLKLDPLRFFNSIVCILLPDPNQKDGYWGFEPYEGPSEGEVLEIGKLSISKRVARVVLDGQHRYRALQLYWEEEKKDLFPSAKIDVPVAYIVVDDVGNFSSKAKDARAKTIQSVRRLFTVLNKSAKLVDKTTLLLIDDSDVTNLISRKLLEDGIVDESLVKWYLGDSLRPEDPQFTTLHTIRDLVRALLQNHRDDWDSGDSLPTSEHLLPKFYDGPVFGRASLVDIVRLLFENWSVFKDWKDLIATSKIDIQRQPLSPIMNASSAKKLASARKKELQLTVAGQKVVFRALATAYLASNTRGAEVFGRLVSILNAITKRGSLSRTHSKSKPNVFRSILFDEGNRMIWANSSVELARKILAIALGAGLDRDAVKKDYSVISYQDSHILDPFWKECDAIRDSIK